MSENEVKTILSQFEGVQKQFEGIHKQLDGMGSRFDGIEERIDILESRMITKSNLFQWVLSVQILFAATIVGTIVVLNSLGMFG